MTSIGSRIGMIHTCDVYRNAGHADSWGQPDASWAIDASHVICRAWTGSETLDVGDGKILTNAVRYVIVPLGTDITELDRIGNIYLRDGSVLWGGQHHIDEIETWPDRLEITLRQAV